MHFGLRQDTYLQEKHSVNAKELLNYQIDWLGVISVMQYLCLIINFIGAPINA